MDVKVGHKYKWNKSGAYLIVTSVRVDKIKFDVHGAKCENITGSMSPDYFTENYSVKDRIKEKSHEQRKAPEQNHRASQLPQS